MDSKKYPFRVTHPALGSNCGQHKTRELAEKRIDRIVAMSKGKLSREEFAVVDDSRKPDPWRAPMYAVYVIIFIDGSSKHENALDEQMARVNACSARSRPLSDVASVGRVPALREKAWGTYRP